MTALSVIGSVLSGVARPSLGHGVGFSLPAFLAAMADGFSFDFTKLDRHFQENTGPTLADDATEAIGLALESREWNGRTLAEELAQQAELKGSGAPVLTGVATAATYDASTGVGSATRVDFSNQSGVAFTGLSGGKTYVIDLDAPANFLIRNGATTSGAALAAAASGRLQYFIFLAAASSAFTITASVVGGTESFTVHSVKEVPTHHGVQSSASLKGTRQVFYGYSDDQPELAPVNFAGVATVTGTVGVVGGTLTATAGGASSGRGRVAITGLTIGSWYKISVDVTAAASGTSAGAIAFSPNDSFGSNPSDVSTGLKTKVLYAEATAATMNVLLDTLAITLGATASFANLSVKEVPASRITTGCKYDGSDDNHLTTYYANSGDNFIVAYVNVPTTMSATQIIAGANDASSTNRWFIAFNTSGQLCGGVGGQSVSTILSAATDWRGKSVVVGISCDGATVRLFADDEIVYEAAQSGTPTTSTPLRIGSNNAAGTAASFTAATLGNVIAGPEYLDLATFLKIRNKLIDP